MEWVSLSRGSGGGGRLKSPSPEPGWKGRGWAQPGVPGWRGRGLGRRGINPFWAAGPRDAGAGGRGWLERNVCPRSIPSSPPGSGRVRLPLICLRGVCGRLSLCLPVVVSSPRLAGTPGVGECDCCPKARVEVRVDREPPAGTGVSGASRPAGAGRGRREGRREGKFRGTGGERCVG